MSVVPPGANGTCNLITLLGYVWAQAVLHAAPQVSKAAELAMASQFKRRFIKNPPSISPHHKQYRADAEDRKPEDCRYA
jgi:hypothetical protein